MADMTECQAGAVAGTRAFHVDGDRRADAAALDGLAEGAVAAHLLGHREDLEAMAVGSSADGAGIALDRIDIDHIAVRWQQLLLVQADRRRDQSRIAAAQYIKKHCSSS